MFSARTAWPREENSLTRAIAERRNDVHRTLLDLTISNPTAVELEYDRERILRGLAHESALRYAPEPFGSFEAREAVSAYYRRRGIAVPADRIVLVATTSEAYSYLFRLLANPGENVAVPKPSYPLFTFLADLSDVILSPYHLRYQPRDGWRLDVASVTEAVDPTTRALISVSPNNPTGSFANATEKRYLEELAQSRGIALISDEVFLDYLFDDGARGQATFIGMRDALTFSLSGVSKIAGLPQMKLSWIVLGGPDALVEESKHRLEIIADTYLSPSTPIQRALPEILDVAEEWQARLVARLRTNLKTLAALSAGRPLAPRPSQGGWYSIVDLPESRDDEAWALELLSSDDIVVHPGYLFDIEEPSAVVVSLIVAPDTFREGIARMARRVSGR